GNIEIDGSNDILTMALGTHEYSGRVRRMGFHVSHRQYFHQLTPTNKQQSFDLKQWQDEQIRKMQQMLKEQEERFKAEIAKIQAGQQSNVGGSNTTPSRPEVQREEVQPQEIHVNLMVAVGTFSRLKKVCLYEFLS
ncbi:hypothetical protein PanWU01x14_213730, partial [Parasponia andersonii]